MRAMESQAESGCTTRRVAAEGVRRIRQRLPTMAGMADLVVVAGRATPAVPLAGRARAVRAMLAVARPMALVVVEVVLEVQAALLLLEAVRQI